MDQRQRRIWLIGQLLREYPEYQDADEVDLPIPHDDDEQRQLLRALQNVRPPAPVSERFLHVQDEYLGGMLAQRAITDADDVPPAETLRSGATLALWQGDITTLRCDAIVNAANSGLTGCYAPNHHCIDNAIHTAAGVQLRLACERIMEQQGHPEPVGSAKITPGFNLPARYVLHTVGPMIPAPACDWPPIRASKPLPSARFPPASFGSPPSWRRAPPYARSAISLHNNLRIMSSHNRQSSLRNSRKRKRPPHQPSRLTTIAPPTPSGR